MSAKTRTMWTFAITSVAVFMATLDNLVVTTALPVIREDLHATVESLEWTVNAYTLTFAVLLLTGAALGDRFGRRRMLAIGLGIFTISSAAAALAPTANALIAARAAQGVGGAIITPLTLTILSAGVPANRRGAFIGAWSGIAGLAVAFGPLVGGAVVSGISWHWIFWLNVPIGIALIPLALTRLQETHGPGGKLDLPGLGLASVGLTGIVWGLVRGHGQGWLSPEIVIALAGGAVVFALFVLWELHTKEPMLPMRFFQNRVFALANVASLLMFFGMFGSIFLLSQFFQTVQGYSPLGSGLRILPWTIMPMFVAPIAGALSDRIGGARLMGIGLTLQAAGLGSLAAHLDARPRRTGSSWRRSWCPASAWRCSGLRSPTSCSPRFGQRRRARRRVRRTRSVSSAVCSASPCSRPSARHYGATPAARLSSTECCRRVDRRRRRPARRGRGLRDRQATKLAPRPARPR